MITIVCVYNNKQVLDQYLVSSLNKQNTEYQSVLIENTQGRFLSAAKALNYGGVQAKGKYLMFAHQDVEMTGVSWLRDTETMLDSIDKFGVAGVAGMAEEGKNSKERGRNIITHLADKHVWELGNPIVKPEKVQTNDGCLLIVPASVFALLKFDENVCDNWHLYDVDYCLSCKEQGYEVYTIPMSIYHRSAGGFHKLTRWNIIRSFGPLPEEYYRTLEKIIKKHKTHYRKIYCTSGDWNTYEPVIWQRFIYLLNAGFNLALRVLRLKR
jgi:hypothetical protein